ncbi:hypothetical protein DPMN_009782 [Dreissena polymorpha]|uniref:Uncharacterized protein n=1 Tax=Dreissena polymorpha TaxID=45954 RepID=A0A9D4N1X2_DREPO|nr:hypothetical protein DPMN_009782 [Dreissena polymorpha]
MSLTRALLTPAYHDVFFILVCVQLAYVLLYVLVECSLPELLVAPNCMVLAQRVRKLDHSRTQFLNYTIYRE